MKNILNNITIVKKINTEVIRDALKTHAPSTKAEISNATGISLAACGKLLNELCLAGEVMEFERIQSSYGRPATSYSYNADYANVAALYIRADKGEIVCMIAIANMLGTVVKESMHQLSYVNYDIISDYVGAILNEIPAVKAISIGIPGYLVDNVVFDCTFFNLINLNISEMLQREYPGIAFHIEKASNATCYGYYKKNINNSKSSIAYLHIPLIFCNDSQDAVNMDVSTAANLGGGFVLSGEILRGFSGLSGEICSCAINYLKDNRESEISNELVWSIIIAIITILNPEIIVLSGSFIDSKAYEFISHRTNEMLPTVHRPTFVHVDNVKDDYICGLISLSLEQLSYNVHLVDKKFSVTSNKSVNRFSKRVSKATK